MPETPETQRVIAGSPAMTRLRAVLVILAGAAAALQVGKVPIAMAELQASFGIGLGAVGAFMAIFSVFGAIGGVPAGALVARWGDRRMLLIGLAILTAAAGIGAMAESYPLLVASRIAEGCAFLLISVAAPALLQRLVEPKDLKRILAIWSCVMPSSIAIGMIVFPLIDGWRLVWAINAGIAVALFAANFVALPRAGNEARAFPAKLFGIFIQPRPMILALMFCAYSVTFYAMISFLPTLLTTNMGVAGDRAGSFSALAPLANVAGNLTAGWIAGRPRRFTPAVLPFAFVMLGITGPAVFMGWLPPGPTLVLAVIFGAVGGLVPATLIGLVPAAVGAPERTPLGIGLLLQGSNLGLIIGPAVVGFFVQRMGWSGAVAVIVIAAIIGLMLAILNRALNSGPNSRSGEGQRPRSATRRPAGPAEA